MKKTSKQLCPVAKSEEGASLLGIILPDGKIAFSGNHIIVDKEFLNVAFYGKTPPKNFRFSSECKEENCFQWTGSKCGVIEEAIEHNWVVPVGQDLPPCSIRAKCRWFNQRNREACAVCPNITNEKLHLTSLVNY